MTNTELIFKLTHQCYEMKLKALEMAFCTGSKGSHIGGAFSLIEIIASLYAVANVNDSLSPSRDRIIISKGHAVLAQYTQLWKMGFLAEEELETFDTNGTTLHGHPNRDLNRAIEFSSGSLGLGISYAVGVALACKKNKINNRIYVIIGDGECDEGIVWEALMAIKHYNLNNVTIIIDRNNYQLDGPTLEVMSHVSIESKMEAFGFIVDIVNGHSIEELLNTLQKELDSPRVIIANTIKAHGISFLENNKLSHHYAFSKKKYEEAVQEINVAYGY